MNLKAMISTQNLTFAYTPEKRFDFPNFSCADRETMLILGKSGKGKTTFLHLMALLLKPTGGNIQINNQEINQLSASQAANFRAKNVGIIYQKPHFVHSLSVMDNLLLANYLAGKNQAKNQVQQLAESLDVKRVGVMHVAASESSVADLEVLMVLAEEYNDPADYISPEEAHQKSPWLKTDEALKIDFSP